MSEFVQILAIIAIVAIVAIVFGKNINTKVKDCNSNICTEIDITEDKEKEHK